MMLRDRVRRAREDGGFALIFVLVLTTAVMAAVGTTLTVVTPNILNAKKSQDAAAALMAAQSGINDAVAYLSSIPSCRSETRVCSQALGATSASLAGTAYQRPSLGSYESFSWKTGSSVTADGYVRVTATGSAGGTSRKLVADLSLQPSILQFGYYSDYESQAPAFLYSYFEPRTIDLTNPTTYAKVSAYNTSGRTISVTAPTTVTWQGPPPNGNNPYPASICGQHWYADSNGPGRYTYGADALWGERGTINGSTVIRTASCDLVWTTGMTEDGPIYSRDAMLVSDGTRGGTGPIFKQPVYSLWGFPGYNTPVPPSQPWRQDPYVGGNISSSSPYAPAIATSDLTLPTSVGEDGIPDNACIYDGPTRVVLNGDGTATVTSPSTTTRDSDSDSSCYPTGSLAAGIVNYTLNYDATGNGAILVKNLNEPSNGWPDNQTIATQTPSASNEIFYMPATSGGATTPDQSSASTATATCSRSSTYKATAAWPCAWTNVYSASDGDSAGTAGWLTYTQTTCGTALPTNRELFECEYGQSSSTSRPSVSQGGGNYAALRSAFQTDLAKGTCLTGTTATQETCLETLLDTDLQQANTSQHAYNYASPANGDHRYVVTSHTNGTATTGAARSVGSAPTNPMANDSLFTYSGNAAQEAPSQTPITMTVSRQVYSSLTKSWGTSVAQFTVTATQSQWSITKQASGAAYFPNPLDVTEYSTGSTASGTAAGSTGTAQPGDLYVQGVNSGRLSLVAQNNVEITGDITNKSNDTTKDAVDITGESYVRNYHPVSCVDQTAADLTATTVGWCPNDITGLYNSILEYNGVLTAQHPAEQYQNLTSGGTRTIDAAIFALDDSFTTDNYNRGDWIGNLQVNGGVYQSHRGANGTLWEYRQGDTSRALSGYTLNYHYVDLSRAELPYAPPVTSGGNQRVWNVVSISAGS